jgi:hypothetical protein
MGAVYVPTIGRAWESTLQTLLVRVVLWIHYRLYHREGVGEHTADTISKGSTVDTL